MKKSISLIVCLLSVLWMQAQSPGGVSGASLWLKADSGASGVTYFNVPSANRTASSNFAGLGPANSTLTSTSSWSAATNTTGDFLTLDLGSAQTVRGVVTRGRGDAAQWVTAYTVSYSTDNVSYISLGSFSGNTDQNTEVINLFPSSVNARYVRFTVNAVSGYPSMRADVIQSVSPVSDNTAVTAWIDSSPSGNNVSQGENTFRPVYRNSSTDNINFNPVVQFNGSSQRMDAASFAINPATATLFSVATVNNITGNIRTIMASHSTSNMDHRIRMNIENAQLRFFKSIGSNLTETFNSTDLLTPAVPFVYSTIASQPGNNTTLFYNGSSQGSSANTFLPNTVNRFTLGCALNQGTTLIQFWNGSIPEAIVYNGMILNAGQRNRIESYLALKYGATLGTTASPVSYLASDGLTTFWTADATYQNNVAGIGLDTGSALHQKQSRSQNTGSQVVVSLGTIAADNLTNGGTIATDRQFFVWGDNNGLLTTFVPTGNTTYPNRFERIWKTQNTGSFAQNITVYYPVSAFGNASSNTIALLYGSSATSLNSGPAAIAQSGTTSINGVSHYIFTVPAAAIANMQFFSFSALQSAPGGVFMGLGAWWKADFSASGSAWADASGNGRNATLASGTITYNANGGTAANFNPQLTTTDGYMSYTNPVYPSTANYDNMNVFAAIQPLSGQNCIPWGEAANNGQSAALFHFNNNDAYFDAPFGYRATSGFIANGGNYGVSNILEGWKNGASMRLHLQTRQIATFATAGGNFFSNTNNANYLFAYPGQVTSGGAGVSEVFAYNTPLSTTDRARVNSYLGIKYGITLDQTTPQNYISSVGSSIWDATTANLGYNNNIAGIGRDDASALLQKQSRSVNSGIQPVIGNGNTIMAANAANGSSFTNNLSFLVWGSNANPATFTTAINYSGLNRLMERIWKVQETGTVSSVRVALRSSDLPFNINNPALIVSSDATINSSDNIIPMTQAVLGGVSYWYADINLNNGEFFTFGGVLASPGGVSTGLQLWLKADTGLNGSQWPDSSGNRTVSTGTGTPALQTGNINFNNSILFNNAAMTVSGTFTQNNHYAFTVANSPITDNSFRIFLGCRQLSSTGTPYPYYIVRNLTPDRAQVTAYQNATVIGRDNGIVAQTTNIHHSSLSTANGLVGGLNGIFTTATPHTAPHTFEHVVGSNRFNFGDYVTLSPNVNTGEIIVYNGVILNNIEQNRVLSYLALKYGTTLGTTASPVSYLASNSSTIWNSDATYQNNIAGIGRDDASALHQKVSRSVNTGSILTLATNNDFVTANNDSGRTGITNDLSFLMIGNNNGSATARLNTNLAAGFTTRITRLWKAQATNYAQAVSMQFSGLDHINFTWNLVWDADGDFTSGATSLGTLNSSGQISLAAAPATGYLSLQANALDSDGDGIIDFDDLDDDNDGILDREECNNLLAGSNPSFNGADSQLPANWTTGATYTQGYLNIFNNSAQIFSDVFPNTNFSGGLVFRNTVPVSIVNGGNYNFSFNSYYSSNNSGALNYYWVITNADGTLQQTITDTYTTGGTGASGTPLTTSFLPYSRSTQITLPSGNYFVGVVATVGGAPARDVWFDDVDFRYLECSSDTDNDGIVNRLDLDSDNDGCVDAIEGAAGITPSQLVTASGTVTVGTGSTASNQNLGTSVNAQGVPQFAILPSGYSNTTGQAIGVSQNATISGCLAPGGVTGASLWLKADMGTSTTTDGSALSQWNDQSGIGNNVTSAVVGNQPLYRNTITNNINFNPTVRFDGSDDFLANNSTTVVDNTGNYTMFGIGSNSGPILVQYSNSIGVDRVAPSFVNGQLIISDTRLTNPSFTLFTATPPSDSPNYFLTTVRKNSNSIYVGLNQQSVTGNLTQTPVAANVVGFDIGSRRRDITQERFNGNMSEVIAFPSELTDAERNRVDSYLSIKYGITKAGNYLASNSAVIWAADAAYQNNIAGIGRDDASALHQRISRSVNAGSILTLATNNDFVTANNDSGRTGIANNLSFLVIGDDNGALTASASPDMASGFNLRIVREWRIQNTNYSQNASLQFSGLPAGSAWHLVWDADGNFASGAVDLGALNSSGQGTFTSAQLSSGYLAVMSSTACYKPAVTVGTTLDSRQGITALGRAGTNNENWPMVRKGAWTVLEAKTKGFVINRLTAAQIAAIPPANLVEGMMVYDTTANCMKVYTSTDGGTTFGWQCITTQTCPD